MKTRIVVIGLLLVSVLLSACTRSATTQTVPTETPQGAAQDGAAGYPPSGDAATMAAVGTELAATATAAAIGAQPGQPAQATATPTQIITQTIATATPIPVAASPTPAPAAACTSPYTVKQGEWIYKIARDCRLDPRAVIAANPNINPNRLVPGQQINLPGAAPTPGGPTVTPVAGRCTGTYTVKAGDNLFRIAYNCGLTTEQMARVNNIAPPYRIFPGQVLRYP